MDFLRVIDVSALVRGEPGRHAVAAEIGKACAEAGFFYITGHAVDSSLQRSLEQASREFFAQDLDAKLAIRMSLGGRAWRGYFPVGEELTGGRADLKEGLYFGAELPAGDPRPMHGPNLFPVRPVELRPTVLTYLAALTTLGHTLLRGIALSLDLPEDHFATHYTADPLILFRIFNYPATGASDGWGVGEHTDYGLLTILKQDTNGGLQVRTPEGGWVDAHPVPGSFVVNLGDMLERLTGGRYRSTSHRVLPQTASDRLSWPFFFDPNFNATISPGQTYGDYLLSKVGKVFPDLGRTVF